MRKVLLGFLLALGISTAKADLFTYDLVDASSGTHIQFTESALLTSVTTVTSFLIDTSSILGPASSLTLDPVSTGTCPASGLGTIAGPCISAQFAGGVGFDTFAPFITVGTYTGTTARSVLTITSAASPVPEPTSILLLGTAVLGAGLRFRKRRA